MQEAYRSTGYKHTEITKVIMSLKAKGRKHPAESKKLISNWLKGDKNPFFKKKHSQETKKLISSKKSKGSIYIYDSMLNLLMVFSSKTKFAKLIFSTNNTLKDYMSKNKLFRGNWYIRDSLLNQKDQAIICNEQSYEYNNFIKEIVDNSHIRRCIFMFDSNTKEYIRKYDSIVQAENILGIRHEKIKTCALTGVPINNYIFSYHRLLSLSTWNK